MPSLVATHDTVNLDVKGCLITRLWAVNDGGVEVDAAVLYYY